MCPFFTPLLPPPPGMVAPLLQAPNRQRVCHQLPDPPGAAHRERHQEKVCCQPPPGSPRAPPPRPLTGSGTSFKLNSVFVVGVLPYLYSRHQELGAAVAAAAEDDVEVVALATLDSSESHVAKPAATGRQDASRSQLVLGQSSAAMGAWAAGKLLSTYVLADCGTHRDPIPPPPPPTARTLQCGTHSGWPGPRRALHHPVAPTPLLCSLLYALQLAVTWRLHSVSHRT